ncbi:hypothetical protein [Barnesiella intestinihominis]|uniref:hypothetical protein n=1 Tax=Barnesiella intestinihominis TaxID=487174 RepID=UPI003AB55D46
MNTKTNSADCRIKIPLLPLFLCVAYKISVRGKSGIHLNLSHVLWHYRAFTPSSPCRVPQHGGVAQSDRGSARRSRGVRIQVNAQTPIRLYRAVKTQGRRRKKGEDRPSGASSADPDGDRGDEPNSPITAGASEFVLLAAEKNEQAQTSFFNPSVTT